MRINPVVLATGLLLGGLALGGVVGSLIGPEPSPEPAPVAAAPSPAPEPAPPAAAPTLARLDAGAANGSSDPIGALATQILRPSISVDRDTAAAWTSQPTRVERRPPADAPPQPEPARAAAPPAPEPEPRGPVTAFQRVAVVDGATFRSGERTIQLAHVVAPARAHQCTDGAGRAWPCGERARAALRDHLRNKRVECRATAVPGAMRCSVEGQDVAAWLVEQGWATAGAGASEPLRAAEADARRRGVGQFVPDRRAAEGQAARGQRG